MTLQIILPEFTRQFLSKARRYRMEFPIKIVVKPNSKKEKIELLDGFYRVEVMEKAENNKANLAVIKILSKHFKKRVYIKSGLRSKTKIIDAK